MKTIIIHHVQEMWNTGLENAGTSFEEVIEKIAQHLDDNYYDKIIVTNFESHELEDCQYLFNEHCTEVYEYGYGWDAESFGLSDSNIALIENGQSALSNYGQRVILGGSHSEVLPVDGWIEDLIGDIYICGAFDGECIDDLETVLNGAGKKFTRIKELIV